MNKLLLLLTILLCACSPSQGAVMTAIAQTDSARQPDPAQTEIALRQQALALTSTAMYAPTPTHTLTATATPTATETVTPLPTETSTVTPTATPDLRVVDTDPQQLLCTMNDMPEKGMYYLPNSDWMSINTNEEVISLRTVEKGKAYVNETGRVTGWWVDRKKGSRAAQLPEILGCGVFMFKSPEGALLAMEKFNSVEIRWLNKSWKYLDRDLAIGQPYIIEIFQQRDSGGNKNTEIEIEFTYQNLLITVNGSAPVEGDVPLEVLEELALKMLERIKQEPLVDPAEALLAR